MIEAKGLKNKLAKFKDEEIENTTKDNKPYYKNIQ